MKIGLMPEYHSINSLKYGWESIEKALADRHEIIHRPLEYFNARKSRRQDILKDLFDRCDVLVGQFEKEVLEYRQTVDKPLPIIGLLFGAISRGAVNLSSLHQYLKTTDIIVGNCTGDIDIARKFFSNAEIRLLSFAYDDAAFYLTDPSRNESVRARMGLSSSDKILMYSGRFTIEKNVHTVLSLFRVLQDLIPDLHLIVAGTAMDVPFRELGVFTVGIGGSLLRLVDQLGIDKKRLHHVGNVDADTLRDLYNIADALINLTLFHDENFGLAQIESMACGTPVVGTKWGGLKDTIIDGQTGYHVSTVVTPSGVKLNWWEAVNKICYLLGEESDYELFRHRSREHALSLYSMDAFRKNIESILSDCVEISKKASDQIEVTPFAREYWDICGFRPNDLAPYQRGSKAFEMYREMIKPFTGMTDRAFNDSERLEPKSILCLGSPVLMPGGGDVSINDPIYPLDLTIPEENKEAIISALDGLTKEPAITLERLLENYLKGFADPTDAIRWILNVGLAVATTSAAGNVDPLGLNPIMSTPIFTIQNVDYRTDVLVIRKTASI